MDRGVRGQRPTGLGMPLDDRPVDQETRSADVEQVIAAWNRHVLGSGGRRFRSRVPRPAVPNRRRQALRLAAIACRTTPRRVAKAYDRGRPWAVNAVHTVDAALAAVS